MSDGAWFRLVLRALGVLVLAFAIPEFLGTLGSIGFDASLGPGRPDVGWRYIFFAPGMAAKMAIGFYLLMGPGRLVRYCMRDVGNICPGCAYDISAVAAETCPECGLRLESRPPPPPVAPPAP
jgi:hypothetical protein